MRWVELPLELLFDELPLGVLHLGAGGDLEHHNPAAATLLDSAWGHELERTLKEMCARADSTAEPVEAALCCGNLGEVRVLVSRAACLHGYLAVLERNVAARVRAENKVMRALLAAATDAEAPAVAAHRALSTLAGVLTGSYLVLYECDAAGRRVSCLTHVGVPTGHAKVLGTHAADELTSLVGRVLATDRPLHVANLSRSFFPFERSLPQGDQLSALALPVAAAGRTLGVLYVCGPQGMLTDGELKLVQGLADAVGTLVAHARRAAALRAQRQALGSLLDNLPDAVFEHRADGSVALAGGRVEAIFGRAPAELEGVGLGRLVVPEDQERFAELLRDATGGRHVLGEVAVPRGEGRVACEVSAWVTQTPTGRIVRSIFRDISRRKELEAELARTRDLAIQRDRLAMIGQLAAGVAHEINNPLSFVKANLALIDDLLQVVRPKLEAVGRSGAGPVDASALESLGEVETMSREALTGVDRIAAIVASLKGLSRSRPDDDFEFEPTPAALQAVQFFVGARHCRDAVKVALPELPRVKGEAGGLSQVILNLLDNAWDAVKGKGTVTVSGEHQGGKVRLRVADDGPGIPPEVQGRIFEPFFTTKGPGKGTGLGLHISHDIAARFGGRLSFETGPTGTTFTVELVEPHDDEEG